LNWDLRTRNYDGRGKLFFGLVMMIKCPRCGKEAAVENNPYRPFCSDRCKLVDLGKWISEKYTISNAAPESEDELPKSPEESPEE